MESTEVRKLKNRNKKRKTLTENMNRSPNEKHKQAHGNLTDSLRSFPMKREYIYGKTLRHHLYSILKYIYFLPIQKDLRESRNVSVKFSCIYLSVIVRPSLHFFVILYTYLFSFTVKNRVISLGPQRQNNAHTSNYRYYRVS